MKKFDKVACELRIKKELATVHLIFHISLLKMCVGDIESIVPLKSVVVKDSISYEEVPVKILDL